MASWWRHILVPWGWEERELPLLATRHENPVHEAFANWRAARRSRGLSGMRWPEIHLDPRATAWVLGGLLAFIVLFKVCSCFAALIFIPILHLIHYRLRKIRILDGRLPSGVQGVFGARGYREAQAIDLWLTGIKGREIAESIYIDAVGGGLFLYRFFFLVPLVFMGLILYSSHELLHIDAVVMLPMTWLLCVQLYRLLVIGHAEEMLRQRVLGGISTWEGRDGDIDEAARSASIIVFGLCCIAAYVVFAYGISSLVDGVLDPTEVHLDQVRRLLKFLIWIATPTLALLVLNKLFLAYHKERTEGFLSRADFAFDLFMRSTVIQDPDVVEGFSGNVPIILPRYSQSTDEPAKPAPPQEYLFP